MSGAVGVVEFNDDDQDQNNGCSALKKIKKADDTSTSNAKGNIFVAEHKVSRVQRGLAINDGKGKFRGCVVWFTGLSGAGKSTVAMGVENLLIVRGLLTISSSAFVSIEPFCFISLGILCYCLDGDNVRAGLNADLRFSPEDRKENIRRVAQVGALMADSGQIVLCSFISPSREDRTNARNITNAQGLSFFEVFVDTPLEECERRDTKGLYRKCRAGEIKGLTGIDQAYEKPERPEVTLDTVNWSIEQTVDHVIDFLKEKDIIPKILPSAKFNPATSVTNLVEELFVAPEKLNTLKAEANRLHRVKISMVDLQWIQVLSEGWAKPLKGFMREDQYLQCLHFNCLQDNDAIINQSVPIVLPITDKDKAEIGNCSGAISLEYDGNIVAIMRNPQVFAHRKEERISRQFGTACMDHPYVKEVSVIFYKVFVPKVN